MFFVLPLHAFWDLQGKVKESGMVEEITKKVQKWSSHTIDVQYRQIQKVTETLIH